MRSVGAAALMLALVVAADTPALEAQGRSERGRDRAAEARGGSANREQAQQQRGQGAQRERPQQAQQQRGQGAQRERPQQAQQQRGQGAQRERPQQAQQQRGRQDPGGPPPHAGRPATPAEPRGQAQQRMGRPAERPVPPPAARERGGMAGWVDRLRDRGRGPAPQARRLPEIRRETQQRALVAAGVDLKDRRVGVWRDDRRGDRSGVRGVDRRSDGLVILTQRQQVARNGGAPAFCRSGAGHPVWGREWCLDKGFGLGRQAGWWGTTRMDNVVFRTRPLTTEEMTRAVLIDVLGDVVLRRVDARRTALGATAPLTGRWVTREQTGTVLLVHSGPVPVAELVDRTGDGRVDLVLFNIER